MFECETNLEGGLAATATGAALVQVQQLAGSRYEVARVPVPAGQAGQAGHMHQAADGRAIVVHRVCPPYHRPALCLLTGHALLGADAPHALHALMTM